MCGCAANYVNPKDELRHVLFDGHAAGKKLEFGRKLHPLGRSIRPNESSSVFSIRHNRYEVLPITLRAYIACRLTKAVPAPTVIWDTTPFRVQKSRDWTFARNNVEGHYGFPCYLVLIGITFLGQIVYTSGLHRATAYDAHLFEQSRYLHPQLPREMNIGDGHFATCHNFFTPVQRTGGHVLTPQEKLWNEWIQLVRARIEHMNSVIKSHGMFRQAYRGWVRNLQVFVNVSIHAAALQMRINQVVRGNRYAGFGPWPHHP